ncbi:FRS (FAR1 Related Sequences) transcription factor family [Actinidia rufa]|uniref:Protein FAR1-RELATED SEQUENCE n=1 Tax=Actinidia rufa TaxID=165716 RepID=A0A7J0FH09_9ERIC|nr:FRS (FAR1 Related Sequences) transcription factor family [Actinidia rufa]
MVTVLDEANDRDGAIINSPKKDEVGTEGDPDFEPRNAAAQRDQKNLSMPNLHVPDIRRPSVKKTDCKASMHVKRRKDGIWTDCISFSGDVFFDISHLKSSDKMPFAPFVGVNHHYQSMLLGCALIADETKSTLVWIMKTWLRAMGGQAPKVIITDQVKALKAAIEEVFPSAHHCFSLWHVLEKIPEALSHRWTKDTKSCQSVVEGTKRIQTRVQRYDDLCKQAIELGEEGSLSEDNYNIACRALVEALKNCVNVNNRSTTECSSSALCLRDIEEENQGSLAIKTITAPACVCFCERQRIANGLLNFRYNRSQKLSSFIPRTACSKWFVPLSIP